MNKISLTIFCLASFLALTAFASANLNISQSTITLFGQRSSILSGIFILTNTNLTYNITDIGCTNTSSISGALFSFSCPTELANGTSTNVSFNVILSSNIAFDSYSTLINASGFLNDEQNTSTSDVITLNINVERQYCEAGDVGDLKVTDVNIENNGRGDDNEWYLFDEIEISVDIKNEGNNEIEDVVVEWCLYSIDNEGCTGLNGETKSIDIDNGDKETLTFTFKVDPTDLDEIEDSHILFIKAYSEDEGEEKQCEQYPPKDIEIMRDKHFIILDKDSITFLPKTPVSCGAEVTVNGKIYNVGKNEEEDVFVNLGIEELGINKDYDASDIEAKDYEKISFNFKIPENATEKNYIMKFTIYDKDNAIFENDDNDKAIFYSTLGVKGNCIATPPVTKDVSISVQQLGSALSDQEFSVKVGVANTGNRATTYSIRASGYEGWASFVRAEPSSLSVEPGATSYAYVVLKPLANITGTNSFKVIVTFDNINKEQIVNVNVRTPTESSSFSDRLSFGFESWVWIVLDIILVVVVIVLLILYFKKSRRRFIGQTPEISVRSVDNKRIKKR